MKYIAKTIIIVAGAIITLGSCRNGKATQETFQVVKKYSGKIFKSAEKEKFYLQHSDDVIRHIEFVKVTCTVCGGAQVDGWGDTCKECDGDGYVYKIKSK